jgi:hypothetical protein
MGASNQQQQHVAGDFRPNQDYYVEPTTENVNLGGFSINTGLVWYWEVSIVICVLLLVYSAKKGIDYWFVKRERKNSLSYKKGAVTESPGFKTVFMKKRQK